MFWTSLIVILTGTWFCVHNISAFPSWQNNILQQAASTVYDDKNDSGVNTYRRDVQREGNNSSASVKASNSSINHDSSITKTPISQVSKGIGGSKNNNSSRNVSATSLPKAKEIPSNVTKLSVKEENATTTLRNSTAAKIGTTSPQNSTKNTEKPDNVDTTEAISTPSPSPVPTTPMPELLHVPWEKVCHTKFRGEDMKILPVFMVGWGLENDCDQFVPLDRFKMDKYANRKPKFDIPGLNIPLVGSIGIKGRYTYPTLIFSIKGKL